MTTKNTGGPAFPIGPIEDEDGCFYGGFTGMTMRDYLAAKAMQELLSQEQYESFTAVARDSYRMADEMLKASEQ